MGVFFFFLWLIDVIVFRFDFGLIVFAWLRNFDSGGGFGDYFAGDIVFIFHIFLSGGFFGGSSIGD